MHCLYYNISAKTETADDYSIHILDVYFQTGVSSYDFLISDRLSAETTSQDEINQYQSLVNTMPHVQLVSDDNVSNVTLFLLYLQSSKVKPYFIEDLRLILQCEFVAVCAVYTVLLH